MFKLWLSSKYIYFGLFLFCGKLVFDWHFRIWNPQVSGNWFDFGIQLGKFKTQKSWNIQAQVRNVG